MTVTTIPVGATGQLLEGWEVNGAVRESVTLTDPANPDAAAEIVSSQPIAVYGLPVWVQGTPNVGIAGTVPVSGQTSTQIVSSIPIYVAQSSAPWTMNGGIAVTSAVTVQGTSSVNVISSAPHAIVGTVSTQIVSSLPMYVSQSSAPWSMNGGVAVTNTPTVNVSTMPGLSGTTMVNVVSTVPQTFNVSVASTQIISSVPMYVAQSTAVWTVSPYATTLGGGNMTTIVCGANLNTTVIKAGPGQIYSINVSYFGSSTAYVKLCNNSTAVAPASAVTKMIIGLQSSTCVAHSFPVGSEYSTGILMYTIRTPFAAGSGTTGILASSMTVSICYE
jgi:hypothetical protein